MKINDFFNEEKTRLDPACWTSKKIGTPKTKVKGGVRVNNCVPAESIAESKERCKQCGMTNCSCKPGTCKCKPIKGWVPNKGFDKAIDEAKSAHPQQAAIAKKKKAGVAEDAVTDFVARGGQIQQGKLHKPRKGETWQGSSHIGAAGGTGTKGTVSGKAANTNPKSGKPVVTAEQWEPVKKEQGVAEEFNGEYDDEAGMADNNLETLRRAVDGIDNVINTGDNLPEWCQEKIAVAKSMLVTVWDYMRSEEQIEDPEIAEMYEAMQLMAESMAHKHRVSVDLVWESFEALDDHMLYETAAWRRKEGKSAKGGLNAKGVASYRRENPGSKLQTAVTTKPSKLKPGSKAAKRRKSFCARMSGVKGPAKKPNGKPTRKTLALRKWNC